VWYNSTIKTRGGFVFMGGGDAMLNNYCVYHLHTEQSLLDSCTNYKLYVDKAKELGQTAICFTEHG